MRAKLTAFALSGFLAAVGMNTFLSGTTASDMEVCARLIEDPDRIATALGGDLSDNGAALRMSGVHDEAVDSLGGMTPNEYYQRTTANLGQEVALKQSRQEHIEAVIEDLKGQQSDISGVNINDEAAQLIIFEKMFQAIAKYFTSLQTMITALMEVV